MTISQVDYTFSRIFCNETGSCFLAMAYDVSACLCQYYVPRLLCNYKLPFRGVVQVGEPFCRRSQPSCRKKMMKNPTGNKFHSCFLRSCLVCSAGQAHQCNAFRLSFLEDFDDFDHFARQGKGASRLSVDCAVGFDLYWGQFSLACLT